MTEQPELVVPQLFTFGELVATVLKMLWALRSVFILMIIGGIIMVITRKYLTPGNIRRRDRSPYRYRGNYYQRKGGGRTRRDEYADETFDLLPTGANVPIDYYPRDILTASESVFFATLQNVCQGRLYIAPKMGLWALVDHRDNVTAWNKISRKHLDFTLCHPRTMKPLLVIELDDSSHRNPKQRLRDLEKDAILKEVGVPVLRIPVARQYDEGAIRNLISGKIKRN